MGDWKLEVIKMGLYITFPVALFHYFNQPEYFEDWVTKTRRAIFPPDSKTHREEIQECIRNIREKKELETLRHLKEQDSGSVWFTRNGVCFLLHSIVVGLYWNVAVVSLMQVIFWIKRINTWFLFISFAFRHLLHVNGKRISSDYLNECVQCKIVTSAWVVLHSLL